MHLAMTETYSEDLSIIYIKSILFKVSCFISRQRVHLQNIIVLNLSNQFSLEHAHTAKHKKSIKKLNYLISRQAVCGGGGRGALLM